MDPPKSNSKKSGKTLRAERLPTTTIFGVWNLRAERLPTFDNFLRAERLPTFDNFLLLEYKGPLIYDCFWNIRAELTSTYDCSFF
jgi:hypothetical protein